MTDIISLNKELIQKLLTVTQAFILDNINQDNKEFDFFIDAIIINYVGNLILNICKDDMVNEHLSEHMDYLFERIKHFVFNIN